MNSSDQYESIVSSLKDKSAHKLQVLKATAKQFAILKEEASKLAKELCEEVDCVEGVDVKFKETGMFQAEFKFGEDLIVFFMHNDVFDFEKSHRIWKTSYVAENRNRAYCGMITMFNFLNNSF